MKKTARTTTAERAGRRLGHARRGCVRKEARAVQWLAGKGLPAGAVRLLFWLVKLTMVVVLLYSAFWLAGPFRSIEARRIGVVFRGDKANHERCLTAC
ncbi:MAG: DUF3742 family protein [Gammaproteobacteria bacterium]|nr:DUF3742 family protein [Gammaproteobacteria bacterium]